MSIYCRKKIGEIKKHKALDNRYNTEVNHLQFDYRNICAMLNFFHKPCHADGVEANEISQKMGDKIRKISISPLESLVKKSGIQFGTIDRRLLKMSDLTDFPRLTTAEMKKDFFFGSYYLKQSKSYMNDINKDSEYIEIHENNLNSLKLSVRENAVLMELLKESKLIGMKVASRHHRGVAKVKYKAFIQ